MDVRVRGAIEKCVGRVAQCPDAYSPPWLQSAQKPLPKKTDPPADSREIWERESADRALAHALAAVIRLDATIREMHAALDPRIWDVHTEIDELTSRWKESTG